MKWAILCILAALLCACNANSPENKYLLAERLVEDKKYEAAISAFHGIVDKSPNSPLGLEAQLKIAQIEHLYLGRSKDALVSYKEFLKRNKDEKRKQEVERVLADLQFQDFEDYDEAIASYSKLIKENKSAGELEDLMYRLGRSFFMKAQFADAVKVFQYMKGRFPNGKLIWKTELELANTLSAQGKCQDAIPQYQHVGDNAPKEQRALAFFGMAICYEEQDDLDKAYEVLSSIKNEYPSPTVVELKMQKIKRRKILRKR